MKAYLPPDWKDMNELDRANWFFASVISIPRSEWVELLRDVLYGEKYCIPENDVTAIIEEKNRLVRELWEYKNGTRTIDQLT